MEVFETYADLNREIDLIIDQIEYNKKDLDYWTGETNVMFDSKGAQKFGITAALDQAERKLKAIRELEDRLKYCETVRNRMESFMKEFEGIEYKIAFKRIVEHKTHQEIADDLGYSHQYIKEKWARVRKKTYKEHTDFVAIR